MKLTVNKNDTAGQISDLFTEAFPGLKLAFVKHHHDKLEGSPKKDILPNNTTIASVNSNMEEKQIEIVESMTVGEVEQVFDANLELPVQVFVQLGSNWIETTATDHYTLKQQMQRHQERKLS